MAAGKKTGGRKKGVPNKATLGKQQEIASTGLTPLDYMLSLLRDENQPELMRFEAAKAAAPYVHPKLANVVLKGDEDAPIQHVHTVDAFTSRISRLAARAGEDEGDREPV